MASFMETPQLCILPTVCPTAALIPSLISLQMPPSTSELVGGCWDAGPSLEDSRAPSTQTAHPTGPQAAEGFLLAGMLLQLFGTANAEETKAAYHLPGDFQVIEKSVGLVPVFPCESCLFAICVCSQNTLAKNIIAVKCELIFSAYFQVLLEISLELSIKTCQDWFLSY